VTMHLGLEAIAERRRQGGPVLVGVDPVRSSFAALRWAAAEATRTAVSLRLVTALSTSLSLPGMAEDLHRGLVAKARGLAVDQSTCLVVPGTPSAVLLAQARQDVSLTVVGRRPFGATEHLFVGHTSTEVAAGSPVPLVVVPEDSFQPGPGLAPVLLCLEPRNTFFSESLLEDPARHVLGFAFERAALAGVPLVVISVHEDAPADRRIPWAGSPASGRSVGALDQRLAGWHRLWPGVELVLREYASERGPDHLLTQAAANAQLVVLGRHSAGQDSAPRLGRTARVVVSRSSRPVAVVPVAPVDSLEE
jgi:nucleotide-binding universal stress UspA family protein